MRTGASGLRLCVVFTLASVFVSTCAQSSDTPASSSALAELEQFAFVPAARTLLSSGARPGSNQVSIEEPLLVGMYEVTRAEFRQYIDAAAPLSDALTRERLERWSTADGALPASFITQAEAVGYARWAGLRLLTKDEWLCCAISARALAYPWADSWQQGRANTLDLGLVPYAPTPVGTFEGGRTATHLYDMLGNVWEWVADERGDSGSGIGGETHATAIGGSYLSYKQEIYRDGTLFEQSLPAGSRLEDLGFRVCAPARAWLEAHAAKLQDIENVRTRLSAVGRRWGPSAVSLLSELSRDARSTSAQRSLEAILVGARG